MRKTELFTILRQERPYEKAVEIIQIAERDGVYDDNNITVIACKKDKVISAYDNKFEYDLEFKDISFSLYNAENYSEEYLGYTIRRMGDGLHIYDENGRFVRRLNSLIIRHAKETVEAFKNSKNKEENKK